jgi:enamine deaminase RidA (YjgF/YER057c/UK114 family)
MSVERVTLGPSVGFAGHRADVVRYGDVVWVSGQSALSADGRALAPGDATSQARIAMEGLRAALAAVGATPADVVRVANYLTNLDDRAKVNVARQELFGETLPASILCEVPRLAAPGLLYEVEAFAMLGGDKQRELIPGAPPPFSHYCDVVRCGAMVWVSGQLAGDAEHAVLAEGDPQEQGRIAFQGLGTALSAVGAQPADVVRLGHWLTTIRDREDIDAAQRAFFGDGGPTSCFTEIQRLVVPGWLYEVESFAVIGGEQQRVRLSRPGNAASSSSDVVRCGELVWVSAQAAVSPQGRVLAPGDVREQVRLALGSVEEALAAVGARRTDVVRLASYMTDIDGWPTVDSALADFAGGSRPAGFVCELPRLRMPGVLYEVEAFAVVDAG